MEDLLSLNDLREESEQAKPDFKRTLLSGYDKKDVERYIESLADEKERIIKAYNEQIRELQTSLSMMVRERDKQVEESSRLAKELESANLDSQAQALKNRYLEEQNKELNDQLNELNANFDKMLAGDLTDNTGADASANALAVVAPPQGAQEEATDKRLVELKVENEELTKNCTHQISVIDKLNTQILELTEQLSLAMASSQCEILNLQGEIHKKNVSCKLIKDSIVSNLNVIMKEIKTISD